MHAKGPIPTTVILALAGIGSGICGQATIDSADVMAWSGADYSLVTLANTDEPVFCFGANVTWDLSAVVFSRFASDARRPPSVAERTFFPEANLMVGRTEYKTDDTTTTLSAVRVTGDSLVHLGWIYGATSEQISVDDIQRCTFLQAPLPFSYGCSTSCAPYIMCGGSAQFAEWRCTSYGTVKLPGGTEVQGALGLAFRYDWDQTAWCEFTWFSEAYGPIAALQFSVSSPAAGLMAPGTQLTLESMNSVVITAADLAGNYSRLLPESVRYLALVTPEDGNGECTLLNGRVLPGLTQSSGLASVPILRPSGEQGRHTMELPTR